MSQGIKTILLIDDEAPMRAFISQTLQSADYVVLEGADYNEAVALFQAHSDDIDLLLVDAALPDKNGFELTRVLSQARPGLVVLFTSGDVGAQLCRFYGMSPTDVRFLKKPFQPIELLERVKCLLAPGRGLSFGNASS
jgi:DNA-binding response OmpR family regulator